MIKTKFISPLKALSNVLLIFFAVISFLFGASTLDEGLNVFAPYADTEFGAGYTPEKFRQVKEGMTQIEVRNLIGQPLSSYTDSSGITTDYYTKDGYLMKKGSFSLCRDLAWYGSSVRYDSGKTAIQISARWYYD